MNQVFRLMGVAVLCCASAGVHAQLKPPAKPPAAGAPAPAAQQPAQPAKPEAPAGVKQDAEKENDGKLAAAGWLLLLDRRDWGTAWERSATLFRKNVPLGTWMDNIPRVREPLGALVQREPVGVVYKTTLPGHPDGDYVSVSFASRFDKKAEVKELVTTVREPDGRWRVTGYSAQ